jgi:hydroxymethylbilane synthase
VLATAGLERLGLGERIRARLAPEQLLPAVGQGVIGVECPARNREVRALLGALEHPATRIRLDAERAFSARLGGSCQSPIAAFAELRDDWLSLRGLVGSPDGRQLFADAIAGPARDAAALGTALADRVLAAGAAPLLAALAAGAH